MKPTRIEIVLNFECQACGAKEFYDDTDVDLDEIDVRVKEALDYMDRRGWVCNKEGKWFCPARQHFKGDKQWQ